MRLIRSLRGTEHHALRLVEARPGESLDDLTRRTGNVWSAEETAAANGTFAGDPLAGGLVKVAVVEPYRRSRPLRP